MDPGTDGYKNFSSFSSMSRQTADSSLPSDWHAEQAHTFLFGSPLKQLQLKAWLQTRTYFS